MRPFSYTKANKNSEPSHVAPTGLTDGGVPIPGALPRALVYRTGGAEMNPSISVSSLPNSHPKSHVF
ncbi:MAG: hypothetical protein LAT55_13330, partial [Opitutales bacterium]|nr:hypothetical protein [Opitutales bacterium]